MTVGTCYFPTFADAVKYYRPYLGDPVFRGGDQHPTKSTLRKDDQCRALVETKIKEGEIFIGKPATKPRDVLFVKENRYHIQEAKQ